MQEEIFIYLLTRLVIYCYLWFNLFNLLYAFLWRALSLFFFPKLLLDFLMYLMHHGLSGFGEEVDCKTLKYPQVELK